MGLNQPNGPGAGTGPYEHSIHSYHRGFIITPIDDLIGPIYTVGPKIGSKRSGAALFQELKDFARCYLKLELATDCDVTADFINADPALALLFTTAECDDITADVIIVDSRFLLTLCLDPTADSSSCLLIMLTSLLMSSLLIQRLILLTSSSLIQLLRFLSSADLYALALLLDSLSSSPFELSSEVDIQLSWLSSSSAPAGFPQKQYLLHSNWFELFFSVPAAGLLAPTDLSSSADHDVVTDGPLGCSSWFPFDVPAGPSSSSSACSWFLSFQLVHYAPAGSTWPPPDKEQLTQLWTSPLLIQLSFTKKN
ncbi:hypothetical protein F511_10250 [Dorcoceras hygrometricum]|uniref:Uncharacterized protein n=1 Tax=Dorcoceras hygrometricum TaxID=472368 RepID=A0A2Z7A9X0_9LAMI|nr:hypothetical protein F511_10250 [Dorcoceras hygrometricum]